MTRSFVLDEGLDRPAAVGFIQRRGARVDPPRHGSLNGSDRTAGLDPACCVPERANSGSPGVMSQSTRAR